MEGRIDAHRFALVRDGVPAGLGDDAGGGERDEDDMPRAPGRRARRHARAHVRERRGVSARRSRALRLFSRSDPPITTKVSLANVLDRSLEMADLRHRARLLRVDGEVPAVDVSETQLGQVCLNPIVNAAQAIPAGNAEKKNEVRVTTGVDERGRAFFAVRDTGSGIAAEHRERIFDPALVRAASRRVRRGQDINEVTGFGRVMVSAILSTVSRGMKRPRFARMPFFAP